MKKLIQFIILFVSIIPLYAEEPDLELPSSLQMLQEALHSPYVYQTVNVITGEYCENETDWKRGGPYPITLKRGYTSKDPIGHGWYFNHPNIMASLGEFPLEQEKKRYHYLFDEKNRLKKVERLNHQSQKQYHTLFFDYSEEESTCKMTADNGHSLLYTFSSYEEPSRTIHPYLLEKVENENGWTINYSYQDHPNERRKLLSKREEPEGRYLINEYYDACANKVGNTIVLISDPTRDPRIGKVKQQKSPVGVDDTPIVTHTFIYETDTTEMRDALGNKTLFRYEKQGKLTAIEHYGDQELPYRKERFFWDEQGQLTSRSQENSDGDVLLCHTFSYNEAGQVTVHTLWGNLSGNEIAPIILDSSGQPEDNGIEKYSTWYTYSEKSKKILLEQGDDETFTRYFYDEGTGALTAQWSGEGSGEKKKVAIRRFYRYDTEGHLIETLIDDGGETLSQRLATRFSLCTKGPACGMPERIDTFHLNFSSGREEKIQTTEMRYNAQGEIDTKTIYDKEGNLALSFAYVYDLQGRLIHTSDSFGNTQEASYDLHGNLLYSMKEGCETYHTYDFANRLIRQEIKTEEETQQASSYRYNYLGQVIASSDRFGNETLYTYDPFGRKVQETLPLVADEQGEPIQPTTHYTYDIFDRILSATDPKGDMIQTRYNVRGKPIEILYPDGNQEAFEYFLNGSLKKSVQKNGCSIVYERDFLARPLQETHYDRQGGLLGTKSFLYSPFHLLEETSHFGEEKETIRYIYDDEGKLFSKVGNCRTEIDYDLLGQVKTFKEWHGEGEEEYALRSIERDESNQIAALNLCNAQKERLKQEIVEKRVSEPLHIKESCFNSWGQEVLKVVTVDERGIFSTSIHDALGRVISIEKRNHLGELLSSKEIRYDAAGNKAYENHTAISGKKSFSLSWTWGPCHRLETTTEGESKICATRYLYDDLGQLSELIKPDGIVLSFTYNALGQIKTLTSSDQTIDYLYAYDAKGRIIQVKDRKNNETTERHYDISGKMSYEKLGNGNSFHFQYDRLGRKTSLTLPDSSKISWKWNAAFLTSIERLSNKEELLYVHGYTAYDLKGRILKKELINGLGEITYHYKEKCLKAIESPFFSQSIENEDLLTHMHFKDPGGDTQATYYSDDKGQLIKEKGLFKNDYGYDALYNLSSRNNENYETDALNQLTSAESLQFSYDLNGSMTSCSNQEGPTYYAYDALGRLTEATREKGFQIRFHYDPFGRRLSKTATFYHASTGSYEDPKTTYYLWDGENEIGACDTSGKIYQLRVLGEGLGAEIGAAVAIELNGTLFAPIHDHRGSVTCLVDVVTGKPAAWYRYSAFGEEKAFYQNDTIENPFRFAGKRIDEETGLIFFGKRYYLPAISRWITKDPLGTPDSANRYAYALNRPIHRIDAQGLFSFEEGWETFSSSLYTFWKSACDAVDFLMYHLNFDAYIRPTLEEWGEAVLGSTFLRFAGFYGGASESGVHGHGEINDKVRITLINGIMNVRVDYRQSLDILSQLHGGVNIHYVFDASQGWAWDLMRGVVSKFGYTSSLAYQLADNWRALIAEMGGVGQGGLIIHYAHSIGGMHTKTALNLLSPEERLMIQVYTFGSPVALENTGLNGVKNFISYLDGVPLFDPVGFITGLLGLSEDIVMVGTPFGIPFSEHFFCGGSYYAMLQLLGKEFLELYLKGM